MKKNLTAFFGFQNLTKKRFSKLQPFFEKNLKKFLKSVKIMMKNVAKVLDQYQYSMDQMFTSIQKLPMDKLVSMQSC